jgi:hypothetical protein
MQSGLTPLVTEKSDYEQQLPFAFYDLPRPQQQQHLPSSWLPVSFVGFPLPLWQQQPQPQRLPPPACALLHAEPLQRHEAWRVSYRPLSSLWRQRRRRLLPLLWLLLLLPLPLLLRHCRHPLLQRGCDHSVVYHRFVAVKVISKERLRIYIIARTSI